MQGSSPYFLCYVIHDSIHVVVIIVVTVVVMVAVVAVVILLVVVGKLLQRAGQVAVISVITVDVVMC